MNIVKVSENVGYCEVMATMGYVKWVFLDGEKIIGKWIPNLPQAKENDEMLWYLIDTKEEALTRFSLIK
jgi:hypothetical protein